MDEQTFGVTQTEERAFRTIRRRLDPSEHDKKALLLAVLSRCPGAPTGPETPIQKVVPPPPQGPEPSLLGSAPSPTAAGTPAAALIKTAAIAAALSGALAFWSGYTVGVSSERGASLPAHSLPSAPDPSTSEAPQGQEPPPQPAQSVVGSESSEKDRASAPSSAGSEAHSSLPGSTTSGRPAKVPSGTPASETPATPTFYNELRFVQRAQSALSSGQPELALGLMTTLDEGAPKGALLTERRVTKVLALCALERSGEANTIARQVLADPSGAAYRARLESSCARGALPPNLGDEKQAD